MPATEQILMGLKRIVDTWQPAAVLWHFYFGLLLAGVLLGVRPSKRLCGFLLGLPLLSVGVIAWLSMNPFNGIVFTLLAAVVFGFSLRLPRESVQLAQDWPFFSGSILFAFGWIYPHFLDDSPVWKYMYAAPIGVIPCATLSIVIGLTLIVDSLNSRAIMLTLGIVGMFYGITGVVQLDVFIDGVLLVGAMLLLLLQLERAESQRRMTQWGVGPRIAIASLIYVAIAAFIHSHHPEFLIAQTSHAVFPVLGSILIVIGIGLWGSGARTIDKAFKEGRLLTEGSYSIVRHPMYSGFIVFVVPGIALMLRSWTLLTISIVAYVFFKILIKREEDYLAQRFGKTYLDYRSRVNAIVPFIRLSRRR